MSNPQIYGIFLNWDKEDNPGRQTGILFSDKEENFNIINNEKYYKTTLWVNQQKGTNNTGTKLNTYLVNLMVDIPVESNKFMTTKDGLKNNKNIVLHFINDTKKNVSSALVNDYPRNILLKIKYTDFNSCYDIIEKHIETNFAVRKAPAAVGNQVIHGVASASRALGKGASSVSSALGKGASSALAKGASSALAKSGSALKQNLTNIINSTVTSRGGTKKRKYQKKTYSRRRR
jgi:hypothetical protein